MFPAHNRILIPEEHSADPVFQHSPQEHIGVKEKYFEDAIKVIYDAFITNAAPAK